MSSKHLPVSDHLSTGVTGAWSPARHFTWVLEIWTLVLMFAQQVIYEPPPFPALHITDLYLICARGVLGLGTTHIISPNTLKRVRRSNGSENSATGQSACEMLSCGLGRLIPTQIHCQGREDRIDASGPGSQLWPGSCPGTDPNHHNLSTELSENTTGESRSPEVVSFEVRQHFDVLGRFWAHLAKGTPGCLFCFNVRSNSHSAPV